VGRSPYQSEKRRKELARLKKQEEKRQRRFNKKNETGLPEGAEGTNPDGTPLEGTLGPDGQPVAQEGPETPSSEVGGTEPPQGAQNPGGQS
jgi:hypothetical protein